MFTPTTPRSRTSSRVGTPIPALSRLTPSHGRPAPSVPSRIHSHGSTSAVQTPITDSPPADVLAHGPHESAGSSASSALTVETQATEGMLIQETDAEVEIISGEQGTASGRLDAHAGDEQSKQYLREQLRRTLNKESSEDVGQRSRKRKGKTIDIHELSHSPGISHILPCILQVLTEPYSGYLPPTPVFCPD